MNHPTNWALGIQFENNTTDGNLIGSVSTDDLQHGTRALESVDEMGGFGLVGAISRKKGEMLCPTLVHPPRQATAQTAKAAHKKVGSIGRKTQLLLFGEYLGNAMSVA